MTDLDQGGVPDGAPPTSSPSQAEPPTLARDPAARPLWRRLAPHFGVLVLVFLVLRVSLAAPRLLTADEADTVRGGRLLVDILTSPEDDPRLEAGHGVRNRLRAGFKTTDNPRLADLPDSAPRRAAIEAPLPRWLAALGIGVLPVSEATPNLGRAAVASSLALALSLALLTWVFRRRGFLFCGFAVAGAFGLNGFVDAGASAGYAASSVLVMTLLIASLERLLTSGRGSIWVGVSLGLCLAVHPLCLALVAAVFAIWAIRRRGPTHVERSGLLALPSAPIGLFLIPIVALVVLIAVWPTLWNDTGKRLGAWLLDFGSTRTMPHEVAGLAFDQASGRAGQAWTAILQWVAWTPLPILALWGAGLARAVALGRDGLWSPLVIGFTLLLMGSFDGSLFGARLSLLALLWIPTLVTAADGAVGAVAFLVRRAERIPKWPRALTGRRLAWVIALLFLTGPILQSARGTAVGLARSSGGELRFPVPLGLLETAAQLVPGATIYPSPYPAWFAPAFDAARVDLEANLSFGEIDEADLALVVGTPIPWLAPRLTEAVAHDSRPGREMSLWRVRRAAPVP